MPKFITVLRNIKYNLLTTPESDWELNYDYKGTKGTTKVYLVNKFDNQKDSLIFHHGLTSTSKYLHLNIIANSEYYNKFNIFVIKASHHDTKQDILNNCINSFLNFTLTIASSVLATEEIVKFINKNSKRRSILVGFSLGGIVMSLHYFFFGSGNLYFPILAYPDVGEISFSDKNKRIIYDFDRLKENVTFKNCYKIPNSLKERRDKKKIFPILGEYDDLIDFTKAKKFWAGYKVKIIDTAHYSMIAKRREIREYILSKIL